MKFFKNWLKNNWIYISILTIVVLIAYGNSLNNAFLSDDLAEIVQNPDIGSLKNLLSSPYTFIRLIFYWIAYNIGGLSPILFRLINISFHLGNVLAIFILLKILYKPKIAFIVASIFAVHPAISEAVVWISGGGYPQYTFFFLFSLIFYIISKKRRFFYILSIILFLFALMSHPVMPLPLFLIFPLYEFVFGDFKKNWFKFIPFFILSILYVFINLGALPERTTTLQSLHYQERGIDNIFILLPVAITAYFEIIFWPQNLTLYHSELFFNAFELFVRSIILIIYLALIGIFFWKKKDLFFWLSFFLISLSPTLTPFRFNWIVAERYLYLPILGIIVAVVLGLNKISNIVRWKYLIIVILAIFLILLAGRTIVRNIDWKSEDNLWIAAGKTSPSSPNNHNNLGDVYGRWGNKQKALEEFQTAIRLKPNYGDAYHNLANTYLEVGQVDKALENYENAIKYNPNLWQSYQNIAAIYFQQKQYEKSLEYIQKAIQINPKNLNLVVNLGVLYMVSGEKEKAKQIFTQVLSQEPQNQIARQGLFEVNK